VRLIYKYILFLCVLLCGQTLFAQQNVVVRIQPDKRQILLGEQIAVTLEASAQQASNVQLVWFNIPDTINHLETVEKSSIDTNFKNGLMTMKQTFMLTGFDSGHWVFPAMALSYTDADGKMQTVNTDSIPVDVLPADVSKLNDYHDIKEIIEVPNADQLYIIIAIAALTLLSLIAVIYFLRKKLPQKVAIPSVIAGRNPFDWAMEEFGKLKKQKFNSDAEVKLAYSQLDEVYRTYVQEKFGVHALQQTSGELLQQLQQTKLVNEDIQQYASTVRLIDVVKFAKYLPGQESWVGNVEVIEAIVKRMEKAEL
jgi:hypothetical protein